MCYPEYANNSAVGISGSVYTQITDVETECNGLMTYDRYLKVSANDIFIANQRLIRHLSDTDTLTSSSVVKKKNRDFWFVHE